MAIKVRGAYDLIGGGPGALDAINGNLLNDKDIAIVVTPAASYFYTLDATSGLTESSPLRIQPDANPGTKMWILVMLKCADPTDAEGVGDRAYNDARYAEQGANSDITSMTGLSDDGIPLAKVDGAIGNVVEDTTPQLGGDLDLHEKAILLNEAPSANLTFNGTIINDTVGEIVAIGDVLYLKSDGKWWKADADAEATTKGAMAMAIGTIAANVDGKLLLIGIIRDDSWAWAVGAELYVSCTPGNPTDTKPSATGDIVRIVGWAITADIIYFNPSAVYVEIA